jgi:hypothetical protein
MSQQIYLMVFGTFGNPHGFKQMFLKTSNENTQLSVKAFDLKTDAITLYPNSKIYAIRKDIINGNKCLSYSIYTYAKEKNSDRGGTFIGSSILFTNSISDSYQTINCLNELQDKLVSNNVKNDTILVNHPNEFTILELPRSFNNLRQNSKEIKDVNFQQFSNNNAVVYVKTDHESLVSYFNNANALLNTYDTIYFTESHEIATYVQKKGLFKILDSVKFENEIQKIEEDKLKKLDLSIIELQNEKANTENERLRNIEILRNLIDQSERIHQENKKRIDESRHELNQLNQKYEVFYNKIDNLIYQLKNGHNYAEIKIQHNENRRRFIDSLDQQKSTANISRFETKKARNEHQQAYGGLNEDQLKTKKVESDNDTSYIFVGLTIILSFVLAGTLIYFLWIKPPEIIISSEPEQEEIQTENKLNSSIENDEVIVIEPQINSELSVKEYTSIAKKIAPEMQLDQIVDIIFSNSSNNVNMYYGGQKDAYSKLLLQLNKDCFITEGNKTVFRKDTLRHIPIYKKP